MTKSAYEKHLNEKYADVYSIEAAIDHFNYITVKGRQGGTCSEAKLRAMVEANRCGELLRKYDPIAFNADYRATVKASRASSGVILSILILFMSVFACIPEEKDYTGYPVVNDLSQVAKGLKPWLITKVSMTGDATNYYYHKDDSTRYIQVVCGKVTIDHRYKSNQ